MKRILFSLLSLIALSLGAILLPFPIYASENQVFRVAVLDPSTSGPLIDEGTKVAVRELISSALVNSGSYTILERSMLDKVMSEAKFTNTDAIDESQATELGKLAGANKVVLSVISKAGKKNMLSVKMIDVETASVERQKAKVMNPDDLLDEVEPIVGIMLGEEISHPKIKHQSKASASSVPASSDGISSYAGIFYNDRKVKYSRILKQKLGGFVKAYFTLGLSAVKRDLVIEGKTSGLDISEKRPEFTICFGGDNSQEHYFNDESCLANLIMVKLKKGGKTRKMQNGSYGLTGVESTLADKYMIMLDIEPKGNGSYSITPKEKLDEGEYCFYFYFPEKKKDEKDKGKEEKNEEETEESKNTIERVYDFTIVKPGKK